MYTAVFGLYMGTAALQQVSMVTQQTISYAFTPGLVDLFSFTSMTRRFIYCNFVVGFEIRQSTFANSLLYRDHSDSSESSAFMLEFGTRLWIWGIFEMGLACGSVWKLLPLYLLLPMYLSHCYDKVTIQSNFTKQDLFWLRAWVYCLLWQRRHGGRNVSQLGLSWLRVWEYHPLW